MCLDRAASAHYDARISASLRLSHHQAGNHPPGRRFAVQTITTPAAATIPPQMAHRVCPVIMLPGKTLMPCRNQTAPIRISRPPRTPPAIRIRSLQWWEYNNETLILGDGNEGDGTAAVAVVGAGGRLADHIFQVALLRGPAPPDRRQMASERCQSPAAPIVAARKAARSFKSALSSRQMLAASILLRASANFSYHHSKRSSSQRSTPLFMLPLAMTIRPRGGRTPFLRHSASPALLLGNLFTVKPRGTNT